MRSFFQNLPTYTCRFLAETLPSMTSSDTRASKASMTTATLTQFLRRASLTANIDIRRRSPSAPEKFRVIFCLRRNDHCLKIFGVKNLFMDQYLFNNGKISICRLLGANELINCLTSFYELFLPLHLARNSFQCIVLYALGHFWKKLNLDSVDYLLYSCFKEKNGRFVFQKSTMAAKFKGLWKIYSKNVFRLRQLMTQVFQSIKSISNEVYPSTQN